MKKKYGRWIAGTILSFAMICVVTVLGEIPVKAEEPVIGKVTGVKQVDDGTDRFTFEWTAFSDEVEYYDIYCSTKKNGTYTNITEVRGGTVCWLSKDNYSKLKAGSSYYVKVAAIANDVVVAQSDAVEMVTAPSAKPKITHTASGETSIGIKWSAVKGANYYSIRYESRTLVAKAITKNTTKRQYTLRNLKKNNKYDIEVTAARKSSSKYIAYAKKTAVKRSISVRPTKLTKIKVQQVGIDILATINGNLAADGYQYQVYDMSGKKPKLLKTVKSTQLNYRFSGKYVQEKKFYAVKVRPYCKINNSKKLAYGKWSDYAYIAREPQIKGHDDVYFGVGWKITGVDISWDAVAGADRYIVYYSYKADSGYKKYLTTTGTSIYLSGDVMNFDNGVYVKVMAQKKVGKKYVSSQRSSPVRFSR